MNSDDLIKRGDAAKAVVNTMETYFGASSMRGVVNAVKHCLTVLPAVPREMSAREYHNIAKRMLATDMRAFNLWWDSMRWLDGDKALAFAENWAKKHPEERSEGSAKI